MSFVIFLHARCVISLLLLKCNAVLLKLHHLYGQNGPILCSMLNFSLFRTQLCSCYSVPHMLYMCNLLYKINHQFSSHYCKSIDFNQQHWLNKLIVNY